MWLGELITDRGVGNGMSVLIFTSIAAGFPERAVAIQQQQAAGVVFAVVIVVGSSIIAAVVFVEQAQRRIPVQYAKRMIGRRHVRRHVDLHPAEGQPGRRHPGHLRLVAALPAAAARQLQSATTRRRAGRPGSRTTSSRGDHPVYISLYFLLIIFFTYFYVAITFNPTEVADNMKKYGGFIPGIRPGRPTAEYLDYILSRITAAGRALPGPHRRDPARSLLGLVGSRTRTSRSAARLS